MACLPLREGYARLDGHIGLNPYTGYAIRGEHPGCICTFHVNEIVGEKNFTTGACAEFRMEVLRVFGPSGCRQIYKRGERSGFCPDLDEEG